MTKLAIFAAALVALPACTIKPAEDDGSEPPPSPPNTEYESIGSNGHRMMEIIVATPRNLELLFAPIEDNGIQLCEQVDENGQCQAMSDEAQAQQQMSMSLADGYGEASCASVQLVELSWTSVAAQLTLDMCTLPNGGPGDGVLTVGATLDPLSMWADFDDFALDTTHADGEAEIAFNQDGLGGVRADLGLDLDASFDDGNVGMGFDRATFSADSRGAVLNGGIAVGSSAQGGPAFDIDATVNAVTWSGQCLPEAGSVTFSDAGVQIEGTFTQNTPLLGTVLVSLNGGTPFEVSLLAPCPATSADQAG